MSTLNVELKEQIQTAESTQNQENLKMKIQNATRQGQPVVVIGLDVHKNFNKYFAMEVSLTGEAYSGTLSSHSSDLLKVIHEMEEKQRKDSQIIPAKDGWRFQVNKGVKTDQYNAYMVMCCQREHFNPVYFFGNEDQQNRHYIRMRDDTEDLLKRIQHQINAFILQLGKCCKSNKENCRSFHLNGPSRF